MNKNEPLNNLSQYKYVYKIYMANNKLNIERLKLIYSNKDCIVILEGNNVRTIDSKVVYLEENLDSAIRAAYSSWKKHYFTNEYFILFKNKVDNTTSKEITATPSIKISVLEKEIEKIRTNIEIRRNWISGYEREIEKFEQQILSLELEISELSKKLGE